ncbi:amino acid ABC transporter permease [Nocardioides insulae]|uniref:amino acid ABC transporter permease n=1 Tax=Nocardioides insulae TaxID=394734 RepID=UPI000412C72F|nr:amino acid ABC transporter permease [Nocardioides insulae]
MSDILQALSDYRPYLWEGLQVTLQLSLGGVAVAIVVSVVLGLAAISPLPVLPVVSRVIVEFFRGTSLVVQLFFLYYVLPPLGLDLGPVGAGIVGLGLNYGAYGSEVVRGSLNAVPKGQWETTLALSMSWPLKVRRVVWPQAWALMLPGLNNLTVMLVKGTAVALLLGLHDLTYWADEMRKDPDVGLWTAYGIVFLLYYLIALACSSGLRLLERRAQRRLGLRADVAVTDRATAEAVA